MSILLALALTLVAQNAGTGGSGLRWQAIDRTPGFQGWRNLVRNHVRRDARQRLNHLCIVVGINADAKQPDTATAYVYWPEQRRIELLGATDEPATSEELFSQGPIRLDRDIIGEHGQTGLSPTAVTRAWVNRLVSRCRAVGTHLVVVKKG